jgi:hypothetical protein
VNSYMCDKCHQPAAGVAREIEGDIVCSSCLEDMQVCDECDTECYPEWHEVAGGKFCTACYAQHDAAIYGREDV